MKKKEVSPEVKQAVQDLFIAMSQKSSVEDFPMKDIPCEYWWVRYAVACTYLSKLYDDMWQPKIDETLKTLGAKHWGSQGCFNFREVGTSKKAIKRFLNSKIFLTLNDGTEKIIKGNDEGFRVFADYLSDILEWKHCPYQMDYQSKCPFYKASEFYKERFNSQLKKEQK